jgi:mannosyltransferase OCH1-like enzyme
MRKTRRYRKRRNQKRYKRTRKMRGGNSPLPLIDYPHFSERMKDGPEEVNGVPLVIYQSYSSLSIPPKMKDCVDKLRHANPEFKHYLYSDTECLAFIKENFDQEVADAFTVLKPGAYKSDLWRYCILYKLGGVYMDIKLYTSDGVSLKEILEKMPEVFVLDIDDSSSMCAAKLSMYNGFMISPPRNDIFKRCIDSIVACCKEKCYKESYLSVTGPCLLGSILAETASSNVEEYKKKHEVKLVPTGGGQASIQIKGSTIVNEYEGYRNDLAATQKSLHYGDAWKNKDIYN